MITELPESEGSVLGVKITGKVTTEMEEDLIKKVDKVIQDHGQLNALIFLDEHARWGLKAGIEDLKWAMKHLKDMKKVAIVADSHFYKWYVALDRPFGKMIGIEEKYFEPADIADAWNWIKE
ncbi:MAG: STAS/SEC14 domain-containing protein [bacterium]|nr:STAS/SEC14 domain-containing protein [bacterium]